MEIFFLILTGAVSGIFGGMGMGGGTILVPSLTIFFNQKQQVSQSTNLLTSIPMSIVSITTHIKNKLIEYKYVLFMLPGIATSVLASFIVQSLDKDLLRKFFGYFLLLLSIFELAMFFVKKITNKRKNF